MHLQKEHAGCGVEAVRPHSRLFGLPEPGLSSGSRESPACWVTARSQSDDTGTMPGDLEADGGPQTRTERGSSDTHRPRGVSSPYWIPLGN